MKKLLLSFFLFIALYFTSNGQNGLVYTPSVPNITLPTINIPRAPVNEYYGMSVSPSRPALSLIDQEVKIAQALLVNSDNVSLCQVQISIKYYSDESAEYEVIGIKQNNSWSSIKGNLIYIPNYLSQPRLTSELKSFLLLCNEYANFITEFNGGLLLTGLK